VTEDVLMLRLFSENVAQLRMRNPSRGIHRPHYNRSGTTSTQEGLPTASGISMPHPVYGPGTGVPPPLPMGEEIEMYPSSSTSR